MTGRRQQLVARGTGFTFVQPADKMLRNPDAMTAARQPYTQRERRFTVDELGQIIALSNTRVGTISSFHVGKVAYRNGAAVTALSLPEKTYRADVSAITQQILDQK
ncbi:hypothetical protein F442_13254 [Phytophthora nicotianae P10297]|uniref:Uncharacterized protein n=1 Tax=Phytophthora nicotianae P10297 TaxID=1317064 RepID=W2YWV5_PHYNI|nr:hypothetical protein F442_13254 [Phytophthora nicotianae P10297]